MAKNKKSWLNSRYTPDDGSNEHYSAPPPADDGGGMWAKSEHPPSLGTPNDSDHKDEDFARPSWRAPSEMTPPSTAAFPPAPDSDKPAALPPASAEAQPRAESKSVTPPSARSTPAQASRAPNVFSNAAPGERTTTIGRTIVVRGKLTSHENLIIRGRIEAEIQSTKDLHLENTGIINADMRVNSVTISGIVVGDIHAQERVKLKPEARVVGDIYTPRLIVEDGATFRGRVEMDGLEHLEGVKPVLAHHERSQEAASDAGGEVVAGEIVIAVEDEAHYSSDGSDRGN